jgi:hypothetical protein
MVADINTKLMSARSFIMRDCTHKTSRRIRLRDQLPKNGIIVMWDPSESQMTISRRNIKGAP